MVIIVGCNHGIQPSESDLTRMDSDELNEHRSRFQDLLIDTVDRHSMQFCGEEWGDIEVTIAQAISGRRGIFWFNINTSDVDKDAMGIPRDYVHGPYTDVQKAKWNRQREAFMVERVQCEAGRCGETLVICGFDHLVALEGLLRQNMFEVQTIDYRTLAWFRPQAFH
jgi:hypothetical protein